MIEHELLGGIESRAPRRDDRALAHDDRCADGVQSAPEPADPVEAIRFRMEQQGLTARDLVPVIGQLNRVYEVLARRRPLMMPMVWRLHQQPGIPAQSLIRPQQRV